MSESMKRRDFYSDDGWFLGHVGPSCQPLPSVTLQIGAPYPGGPRPAVWMSVTETRRLSGLLLAAVMEVEEL